MPKRILVPLDHTSAIDSIAPLAASIARTAGASVRLLHVASRPANIETAERGIAASADQEMDRLEAEDIEFLREIGDTHLAGVPVECVVRFGEPAEEILSEIRAFDADAVVIGTNTRAGTTGALLGTVAAELIRRACATVLLVRAAP